VERELLVETVARLVTTGPPVQVRREAPDE
jgi:hypothetical protein